MKQIQLGKTDLKVSVVALGTVSLGMDYGINVPGQFARPHEKDVTRLLQKAVDSGINFFDTAPNYGEAERLLGVALKGNSSCYVATKVTIPDQENGWQLSLGKNIEESVDNSLLQLNRETLDIVQIHNATIDILNEGAVSEILYKMQKKGKIRFLGVSVYSEEEAMAAIESGFEVVQVAYSLLDQRMASKVFPAAMDSGVGLMIRSAFLKGALTAKAQWLPDDLEEVKKAAVKAKDLLAKSWQNLPEMALRFCFSTAPNSTVLVGVRSEIELNQAVKAANAAPLATDLLARTSNLSLEEERHWNPSNWSVV